MFQPSPTDPIQKAVLLWLSNLALRGGGYELHCVRGWAQPSDVADALERRLATDVLARLASKQQLIRANIAPPSRGLPLWLYRINGPGAAAVGRAAPPEPKEASTGSVLIFTNAQWIALLAARRAKLEPTPTRFLTREIGWRTVAEIRAGAATLVKDSSIWPEDVYFLERAGLLEKRQAPGAARVRPLTFYRVTAAGDAVSRLEYKPLHDMVGQS